MSEKVKLVRFSKPRGTVFEFKEEYYKSSPQLVQEQQRKAELYRAQPPRVLCKNCEAPLGAAIFYKNDVPYVACSQCGHLNGGHEDTEEFCRQCYVDNEGAAYAADYQEPSKEKYNERVKLIYAPKVAFLEDALKADGADPATLSYADIGSGAGHFVAALTDAKLNARGFEVSELLVAEGKRMQPQLSLELMRLEDTVALARDIKADVVTMIGVLEHVRQPREVIAALRANPAVKYVFIFVPILSLNSFIEMTFPHVAQRVLYGEHTHLYTGRSLKHLQTEFGLRCVGEWWFGADIDDLYRSMMVTIAQDPRNQAGAELFGELFVPLIDPMQAQVDRQQLCSEVHMLLAFDKD